MSKSQSAIEYLVIVAITFAMIIPTTYLFFSYSKDSNSRMVGYRVDSIGKSIIISAESIYHSGGHSKTVLEVDMPTGVNGIAILSNRELVFNATFENSDNELVFFSAVNITGGVCNGDICTFPETFTTSGIKRIKIESIKNGNQVIIQMQ